ETGVPAPGPEGRHRSDQGSPADRPRERGRLRVGHRIARLDPAALRAARPFRWLLAAVLLALLALSVLVVAHATLSTVVMVLGAGAASSIAGYAPRYRKLSRDRRTPARPQDPQDQPTSPADSDRDR